MLILLRQLQAWQTSSTSSWLRFPVLSVEADANLSGLCVVRLQHLGAWVSDDTYALPEIAMGQVRTCISVQAESA